MSSDASRTPLFFAALIALALIAACGQSDEPEPAARPSPSRVRALPSNPTELWVEACSRCHRMQELRGATAARIEAASETVQGMHRFRGRLSQAQLQGLSRLIEEETAPRPATTPRTATTAARPDGGPILADGGPTQMDGGAAQPSDAAADASP